MNTDAQRAHPTEVKGRFGRQYEIKCILQDKGSLLGRVFLAMYVLPKAASIGYQLGFKTDMVIKSLS